MVRAKHKINKITIQVIFVQNYPCKITTKPRGLIFFKFYFQVETQQQAVEADCLECQPLL